MVDCADLSGSMPISTHLVNVSIAIITSYAPVGDFGYNPTTVSRDHCYSGAEPLFVGIKNLGNLNLACYFYLCNDDSETETQSE